MPGTGCLSPRLTHDRYAELVESEARRLAAGLAGADLATPVPSCPGWNLAQLTQHVGEELRWLEGMVRSRATEMADDTAMRHLDAAPERDAAATAAWIAAGGVAAADALRGASTDTPMWSPFPGEQHVGFFARRFAHEGALHRVDAELALGRPVDLERDAALDALAEWMEHGAHPFMLEIAHPERRALLGPGRMLRVTADDVGDHPDAAWLIDLTGDALDYRPDPDRGVDVAVSARGPLTDLLLVLYRRRAPDRLAVAGDRALLEEWLAASAFA